MIVTNSFLVDGDYQLKKRSRRHHQAAEHPQEGCSRGHRFEGRDSVLLLHVPECVIKGGHKANDF